jgi:hypothetical protein
MIASTEGEINPRRLGKWLAANENALAGGYKLMRTGTANNRGRQQGQKSPPALLPPPLGGCDGLSAIRLGSSLVHRTPELLVVV